MHTIDELQQEACKAIEHANDMEALEALRVQFFGKKGRLTDLLKQLAVVPAAEKPQFGQKINQAKQTIVNAIEQRRDVLKEQCLAEKLQKECVDVTLPGRKNHLGTLHPITQMKQRLSDYFVRLGFDVISGPEIESEFYNFEALNIPLHHPSRAMHDTFYFGDGRLLRTHTSPVQIRSLEQRQPPVRLIAPGRVYRCDSDLTHTPMFHQVEGLCIDQTVTLSNLNYMLRDFFAHIFGREVALRFRPSYFPFTEPSAEVDIACTQCHGKGCRLCKYTGWLEVLGCGMIHPQVLQAVNISSSEFQGWAFGMGIDRLAMLYYEIDDLRLMFENDISFLQQF